MAIKVDHLVGKLRILRIPENLCWTTPREFITKLVDSILAVELPFGDNEVTTVYGFQTPTVDDAEKPWFRTDRNGNFLGWFYRFKDAWREAVGIGVIRQFVGDPATPEAGWVTMDGTTIGYPDTRSLWKGTAPNQMYWAVFLGY